MSAAHQPYQQPWQPVTRAAYRRCLHCRAGLKRVVAYADKAVQVFHMFVTQYFQQRLRRNHAQQALLTVHHRHSGNTVDDREREATVS